MSYKIKDIVFKTVVNSTTTDRVIKLYMNKLTDRPVLKYKQDNIYYILF